MDQKAKQESKYAARSMMRVFSDKMEITGAKFSSSSFSEIEVACVKATLEDEVVPKEKHVQTLKLASAGGAPRQQVNCVIGELVKRFETHKSEWLITLKTLVVFHRLIREVDPTFQEEILKYSERTQQRRILRLDGFADHATRETWDMSAWIRIYSVYLDERLETFRTFRFDPEDTNDSKLKDCSTATLLERLPLVQKLLSRLILCVPQGPAQQHPIVIQACEMVMKELRATYKAVCEGVMNLADKFFDMERGDALRGLEAYKENAALNEKLNEYFAAINAIGSLRGSVQFPSLQSLPPDFLTTLEDYVKDAPKTVDPTSSVAVAATRSAAPPPLTTTASFARQGGTTSPAVSGVPPTIQAPIQGVLKIGPPLAASAPPHEVDLLGGDFAAMNVSSPTHGQQYGQPPMQQQQQQYGQSPEPAQQQYSQSPVQQQQQYGQLPAQQQYGQPPVQQQYGQPPAQQQFGHPPAQQHYGLPPAQQQYGHPPAQQQYGQPPVQQQYGQPPAQQHYGQPPAQQQYGQPAAQQPPQFQQAPSARGFGDHAFGGSFDPFGSSAAAPLPSAAAPSPASSSFDPFGGSSFNAASPAVQPSPSFHAAPQAAPSPPPPMQNSPSFQQPGAQHHYAPNPGQYAPQPQLAAPASASNNPFGGPAFPPAAQQSNNPFGGPAFPPAAQSNNPFGGPQVAAAPAWGAAASNAAPAGGWAPAQPAANNFRKDPLQDLSFDLLGAKPAAAPQKLKDMRSSQGNISPNLL